MSRITELTEIVQGDTTVAEFSYDNAGRLETVTRDGQLTASYDYDDNGNRLSLTTQSGTVTGTYDDQDRLLRYGSATDSALYRYGRNGELQEKVVGTDTTRYTYDALGNLTAVELPNGSGTTNGHRDAWFVGYTPSLVVAVWVGFDDGRSVGLPGSRAALPIFAQFLTAATGNGTRETGNARGFEPPPEVEMVEVDRESGLRAGWGCGGEAEYFLEGTAPEREADDCGSFWTTRRWLASEGERFYREVRPRIEREFRSSVRELRRLAERYGR